MTVTLRVVSGCTPLLPPLSLPLPLPLALAPGPALIPWGTSLLLCLLCWFDGEAVAVAENEAEAEAEAVDPVPLFATGDI